MCRKKPKLLNHTSSFHDDAEEEAGEQYSELFVTSPNYEIRECRDFLKNFAYKKPNFELGSDVRYCNCSYVLLGLAIEKITGKSYREYVMENVFRKASTRFSIVKRSKGHSAVEKASYISRSVFVSEFDGQTYRPKYHEDLVHSEITLPPNAPKEYADRANLWNAVKGSGERNKRRFMTLTRMAKRYQ